jgi:heme oxygenase
MASESSMQLHDTEQYLIENLRKRTKEEHQQLDHYLYPFIQQIRTTEDYSRLLKVFYGFFKPMQAQFDLYLSNDVISQYEFRRKPEWLLQDLASIDEKIHLIPQCSVLPAIDNQASAFGSFYVLEGSSMGGQIIAKKIRENLGYKTDDAISFFKGYGENSGNMWKNFLGDLVAINETVEQKEKLIASAQETFKKFKDWLVENYG